MQKKLDRLINKTVAGTKQKTEEDLDFFFDNNASQKKEEVEENQKAPQQKLNPYSTSRKLKTYQNLKISNLNIAYAGVKVEDLYDRNFLYDTYVLVTKNLNPFLLERKIFDVKNREMIFMFWEE